MEKATAEKNKTIFSNVIWRILERAGAQGVTFIVTLIMARIVSEDDYGLIAIVTVFVTFSTILVESGFSSALIQKENADDLDFSSVFYCQLVLCVGIYLVLFFAAPLIARWYDIPQLCPVLRVQTTVIIISGVRSIQTAYVSRHMMFKKFFFATIAGTIGAAVLSIWMIFHGFGVWALVAQFVFNNLVGTIILWIVVPWRPKKLFSFSRLKELLDYGWKILAANLLDTSYYEIRQLVIGLRYSAAELAYFNRGETFPNVVLKILNTSLSSVIFPAMSIEQHSRDRIKIIAKRTISAGSFMMFPMLLGLAACGRELIVLLVTEKYLPAVPYLQIYALVYAFYPVKTAVLNAYNAVGRSDLNLKLGLVNVIISMITLFAALPFGVMTVAVSMLVTNIVSLFINAWKSKELFDYGIWEQFGDVLPALLLSGSMWVGVWAFGRFVLSSVGLPLVVRLLSEIVLGIVIYLGLALLTGNKDLSVLIQMGKNWLNKRKTGKGEAETLEKQKGKR